MEIRDGFSIVRGKELNEYVEELSTFEFMRQEVDSILMDQDLKPILILGNRRFGKTTILKMLDVLNSKFKNVYLITLTEEVNNKVFLDYVVSLCRGSLVLIDEASNIRLSVYKLLCENAPTFLKSKLIFTGTNSLLLFENTLPSSAGYDRAKVIEIKELTPSDYYLKYSVGGS